MYSPSGSILIYYLVSMTMVAIWEILTRDSAVTDSQKISTNQIDTKQNNIYQKLRLHMAGYSYITNKKKKKKMKNTHTSQI